MGNNEDYLDSLLNNVTKKLSEYDEDFEQKKETADAYMTKRNLPPKTMKALETVRENQFLREFEKELKQENVDDFLAAFEAELEDDALAYDRTRPGGMNDTPDAALDLPLLDDLPDLGGENTFEQCVSEMALAGFTGSEVGNKYPKDPEVLKKALELRGIEICNQWFSSFLITKPFEEVEKEFRAQLTFLKTMGAKVIGASEQSHSVQGQQDTPIFGYKYVMNDDEWKTFCEGMNRLGKIAKDEYGIALTFHHHMGTVVQDPDEVERMMANTDPEYVSLLFDTGHFTYCGADPLEMVTKYVDRIKHVHMKDIRPEIVKKVKEENLSFLEGVRQGAFTVPADGCIDFDPIFKVLEDHGYEGYMLVEAEQDPAKANPLEYAIKARKFIAEKTGL